MRKHSKFRRTAQKASSDQPTVGERAPDLGADAARASPASRALVGGPVLKGHGRVVALVAARVVAGHIELNDRLHVGLAGA